MSVGIRLAVPLKRINIAPLTPDGKSELKKLIGEAKDEMPRERLTRRLGPLLDTGAAQRWESSADRQAWIDFSSRSKPDPAEFSNDLAELACNDDSGGYIIKGIARRISSSTEKEAYAKLTAAKLINKKTCPAAKHLSEERLAALRKFATAENTEKEPPPVK